MLNKEYGCQYFECYNLPVQTAESRERFHIPRWYDIRREEHMAYDNRLIGELIKLGISMPDRKTMWTISQGETFPEPLAEALDVVKERFRIDTPFDTAIVKRYVPGNPRIAKPPEPSEAFTWHQDPDEYGDEYGKGEKKIVLWSVTGRAQFSVLDGNKELEPFVCLPNSALLVPAHMKHRVTPPDPAFGTRILLFFGQRG